MSTEARLQFSICLHDHQPVGNFDGVIEKAYRDCYAPVLECLRRHPGVGLAMHHSGCLLDWLEARHPEYLEALSAMCREGRLELVSGGYYEPIIPVFRPSDIRSQIVAMNRRLETLGGSKPTGLWLTERVWEPSIPSYLAGTGIGYAVVDDLHIRLAGAGGGFRGNPVLTEDSGSSVALLGSSMELRYAIPFGSVDDVMAILRRRADEGASLVFYGDDGEKFGVWPGTRERCHDQGWLDEFLTALEEADGWLAATPPGVAVSALPAEGPFYVPAASYPEMGEWALDPGRQEASAELKASLPPGAARDADLFLRAGFWRNFLTRYPEANSLHKRVLHAEDAVRASGSAEALAHFWRSQCNCPYWHGVFGGLYLPHLRDAVWTELLEAERAARDSEGGAATISSGDYDCDGSVEILAGTPSMSVEARAGDGLALGELSLLPAGRPAVTLGNVLTRRREAYHSRIRDEAADRSGGPAGTIHGEMHALESGLASMLAYDPYRRLSFREVLLPGDGREWFSCGGGGMTARTPSAKPGLVESGSDLLLSMDFPVCEGVEVSKRLAVSLVSPAIRYDAAFELSEGAARWGRAGCEICANLLTGSEDDRNVSLDGRPPVRTGVRGEGQAGSVCILDGWRRFRAVIRIEGGADVWHMPLDSVNRSEKGYERVHQGMAILISRPLPAVPGRMRLSLSLELEDLA